MSRKLISILVLMAFLGNTVLPPNLLAQTIPQPAGLSLPPIGTMINPTAEIIAPSLRGMTIHPENPFRFDFIVDRGQSDLKGDTLKPEANKLIRYFLASLTVPENDLWVNLSPNEKDRIIPNEFGTTEMGRDMLAQDYILKQLTASLIYPENDLGKQFWQEIYAKAQAQFGTTDIPVNTFNKVWIVPDKAVVYEHDQTAVILESHLKVMLEQDYLGEAPKEENAIATQIVREIVLPAIEKEVNTGENFVLLRQIYHSLILAAWYKRNLKQSILSQVYVDQNKISGVDIQDKEVKEKIYAQYLEAFKKGVYDLMKEEYDPETQEVVSRRYFSGGLQFGKAIDSALLTQSEISSESQANLDSLVKDGRFELASTDLNPAQPNVDAGSLTQAPAFEDIAQYPVKTLANRFASETEDLSNGILASIEEAFKKNGQSLFENKEKITDSYLLQVALGQVLTIILENLYQHEFSNPDESFKIRIYRSSEPFDGIRVEFWGPGKDPLPVELKRQAWFSRNFLPWNMDQPAPESARSPDGRVRKGVSALFKHLNLLPEQNILVGWRDAQEGEGPQSGGHIIALHIPLSSSDPSSLTRRSLQEFSIGVLACLGGACSSMPKRYENPSQNGQITLFGREHISVEQQMFLFFNLMNINKVMNSKTASDEDKIKAIREGFGKVLGNPELKELLRVYKNDLVKIRSLLSKSQDQETAVGVEISDQEFEAYMNKRVEIYNFILSMNQFLKDNGVNDFDALSDDIALLLWSPEYYIFARKEPVTVRAKLLPLEDYEIRQKAIPSFLAVSNEMKFLDEKARPKMSVEDFAKWQDYSQKVLVKIMSGRKPSNSEDQKAVDSYVDIFRGYGDEYVQHAKNLVENAFVFGESNIRRNEAIAQKIMNAQENILVILSGNHVPDLRLILEDEGLKLDVIDGELLKSSSDQAALSKIFGVFTVTNRSDQIARNVLARSDNLFSQLLGRPKLVWFKKFIERDSLQFLQALRDVSRILKNRGLQEQEIIEEVERALDGSRAWIVANRISPIKVLEGMVADRGDAAELIDPVAKYLKYLAGQAESIFKTPLSSQAEEENVKHILNLALLGEYEKAISYIKAQKSLSAEAFRKIRIYLLAIAQAIGQERLNLDMEPIVLFFYELTAQNLAEDDVSSEELSMFIFEIYNKWANKTGEDITQRLIKGVGGEEVVEARSRRIKKFIRDLSSASNEEWVKKAQEIYNEFAQEAIIFELGLKRIIDEMYSNTEELNNQELSLVLLLVLSVEGNSDKVGWARIVLRALDQVAKNHNIGFVGYVKFQVKKYALAMGMNLDEKLNILERVNASDSGMLEAGRGGQQEFSFIKDLVREHLQKIVALLERHGSYVELAELMHQFKNNPSPDFKKAREVFDLLKLRLPDKVVIDRKTGKELKKDSGPKDGRAFVHFLDAWDIVNRGNDFRVTRYIPAKGEYYREYDLDIKAFREGVDEYEPEQIVFAPAGKWDARPKSSDAAGLSNKNVGGIDFNPNKLEIETRGEKLELDVPLNLEQYQNINGLVPVIFNIQPITTLPMLLGQIPQPAAELAAR